MRWMDSGNPTWTVSFQNRVCNICQKYLTNESEWNDIQSVALKWHSSNEYLLITKYMTDAEIRYGINEASNHRSAMRWLAELCVSTVSSAAVIIISLDGTMITLFTLISQTQLSYSPPVQTDRQLERCTAKCSRRLAQSCEKGKTESLVWKKDPREYCG